MKKISLYESVDVISKLNTNSAKPAPKICKLAKEAIRVERLSKITRNFYIGRFVK